jgi:hypothetical protein
MVNIKSNIGQVTTELRDKLLKLADKENLPRILAFDTIDLMTKRIHIDGKDSKEGEIGSYSNGYLELRKRKYNRSADPKVIISLTRQLENDWSVIATSKGYGVGFKNTLNFNKSQWVENTYKKKIFALSPTEEKKLSEIIAENVSNVLK